MNGYNALYLPAHLLISPQELFNVPSRRVDSLYHGIKYRIEELLPIASDDLTQAAYFPHLFEDLLAAGWVTSRETDLALQRPDLRFGVLMQDYSQFSGTLEPLLLADTESVERLLAYFRKTGMKPRLPEGEYLRLLENDPDRFFRAEPNPREEARDRVLRQMIEKYRTSPAHALFWLKLKPADGLTPDVMRALRKSDTCAYEAARFLAQAGVSRVVWAPLLAELTAPRWIYHAMRDQLLDPSQALLSRLCREPEWAAQWTVHQHSPLSEIEEVYAICMTHAMGHPLFHDLSLWFERKRFRIAREQLVAA